MGVGVGEVGAEWMYKEKGFLCVVYKTGCEVIRTQVRLVFPKKGQIDNKKPPI